MKEDIRSSIYTSIDAMQPIIYIKHFDFFEVDNILRGYGNKEELNIYEFNLAVGTVDFDTKKRSNKNVKLIDFLDATYEEIANSANNNKPNFIVLKGIHSKLEKPRVVAWLQRFAEMHLHGEDYEQDSFNATIFIVSPILVIPHALEPYIAVFDKSLPDFDEIYDILDEVIDSMGDDSFISDSVRNELAIALKGLNSIQIKQVLNLAYSDGGSLSDTDCKLIMNEKQRLIKKSGLLELIKTGESFGDIGGLDHLKSWLKVKAKIYQNIERARQFGVDVPQGVLIVGLPGCGKSLTAKAAANLFDLSLVRLDIGRLLGKYVGESEGNMRQALELAEAISPCVLWIDEVEKAFSGLSSGQGGGGSEVTTRLFGQFLTWMQEKESPVFIVATANDITNLPPEFLRRGRFDEIFAVKLPSKEERKQILEVHIYKRLMRNAHSGSNTIDFSKIDLDFVINSTEGFNGADLEALVKSAFESAFIQNKQSLSANDFIIAFNKIKPISVTLKDKIDAMNRKLDSMNIMSAS